MNYYYKIQTCVRLKNPTKYSQILQDLERVRNLCYMVSRREKLQRSFVKLREQTLAKQLQILGDNSANANQQASV